MLHPQVGQQAQPHRLMGHRIRARNHRLRGDDRGHGGQHHQRDARPRGRQIEEGVVDAVRVAQDHRTLAEVIDQQTAEHQPEPRLANGPGTEMPHVCVEGLGAGDGQHDRGHGHEGDARTLHPELDRIRW
ncbi:hypothetical protein SDC9_194045 [bioreactor metagenome]|uniref:Uncharacterized protein n=1 Tax=bioreactor metagenome TaxID=1076179 RepID=A0A645I7U4_9ZZZZ